MTYFNQAITPADLINFEARVQLLWEEGDLPYLTHLSGGNEQQLLDIFADIKPGDWIFASHRCHYHYLLAGLVNGKTWTEITTELLLKIRAGQSMFLYSKDYNFLASAICAGNCAIAAGTAWAMKRKRPADGPLPRVWCFLGDGAEEEGHFYEAVRWVEGHVLPCTFIIEDNDRSCSTTKEQRRGDYAPFLPFLFDQHECVRRYRYTPTWPHAGSGCAHHIQFKTLERREQIVARGGEFGVRPP
jgi:TPP-dependent pyruvate/acetoin dehydrogenase alpha subunit